MVPVRDLEVTPSWLHAGFQIRSKSEMTGKRGPQRGQAPWPGGPPATAMGRRGVVHPFTPLGKQPRDVAFSAPIGNEEHLAERCGFAQVRLSRVDKAGFTGGANSGKPKLAAAFRATAKAGLVGP